MNKYEHIKDCWNELRNAATIDEVESLFNEFPRWSGDWSWYSEDGYVVVENAYYDNNTDSYEVDRETLDIYAVKTEEEYE